MGISALTRASYFFLTPIENSVERVVGYQDSSEGCLAELWSMSRLVVRKGLGMGT